LEKNSCLFDGVTIGYTKELIHSEQQY
jgi:hypothetical protein